MNGWLMVRGCFIVCVERTRFIYDYVLLGIDLGSSYHKGTPSVDRRPPLYHYSVDRVFPTIR